VNQEEVYRRIYASAPVGRVRLLAEVLQSLGVDEALVLCVAIVGGAVIPPLTGRVADLATLSFALFVPAVCYVVIAAYGVYARRPRVTSATIAS
jgi:FHS family L-fucose permease-like MFS transporter